MDPSRSEVFRGLGGAYQSEGQHQMAFASYQQAINLCPTDLLAYLKLGLLYEQLVSAGTLVARAKKWRVVIILGSLFFACAEMLLMPCRGSIRSSCVPSRRQLGTIPYFRANTTSTAIASC